MFRTTKTAYPSDPREFARKEKDSIESFVLFIQTDKIQKDNDTYDKQREGLYQGYRIKMEGKDSKDHLHKFEFQHQMACEKGDEDSLIQLKMIGKIAWVICNISVALHADTIELKTKHEKEFQETLKQIIKINLQS